MRGGHIDFTTAPINRAIVLLAVPMVIEMLMESVFAVVDVFWVAHLGPNAVAAVGLTESLLIVIYTLAMGVSIGAMALIARRIGEGDREAAARAAAQSIILGIIVSAVIAFVGYHWSDRLLALMGASAQVIATGGRFATIMLSGNIVIMLLFVTNAVFRGAGDAAIAMRVLWLANSILQRRGRYVDADADQPRLFLGLRGAAGLVPVPSHVAGTERCVHRAGGGTLPVRGGFGDGVPRGAMEADARVSGFER